MKNSRPCGLARLALGACIFLALSAAGCAKKTAVAPLKSNQTVSACDALGQTDATAVLGGNVTVIPGPNATQPDNSFFISNCSFASDEARTANILIRQAADASVIRSQFNAARSVTESLYGVKPQELTGIGEAAFWVGNSVNQLNILKGGRWITIMVFGMSDDNRFSLSKSIAARMLRRL